MNANFLSVIVPVYKQEKTIKSDLLRITKALQNYQGGYEVIAVVDGNLDNSLSNIKKTGVREIKPYQLSKNHGKGYAVRYGMARSKGGLVAFIDAGMEIDPKSLLNLLTTRQDLQADIVIGSKRHAQSKVQYPLIRRFFSFGYQTLVFLLFGLKVKDTQVGVKVFRREVLEDVLPRLLVKRYAFDIEILAVANYLGYKKIVEAPVTLHYNFSQLTSAASFKTIKNMLIDTLAVFYRLQIKKYYSDSNRRRWVYDKDLDLKINVG